MAPAELKASTLASAASPWPRTHSGSGPSSGRPVKNFAAMQPPPQASKSRSTRGMRHRLRVAQVGEQRGVAPDPLRSRPHRGRCRRGTSRGSRTGRRRHHRPDRSGRPPGRRAQVQAGQRTDRTREVEEGVTGEHAFAVGRPASRKAHAAAARSGAVRARRWRQAGRTEPGQAGAERHTARAAPRTSSSWPTFWRVTTTESLKPRKPACARVRHHPPEQSGRSRSPRTASLTSSVAPSSEICTSM